MAIAIEGHARWDLPTATRIARVLEPYEVMWLEEIMPPDNVEAYVRLKAATHVRICQSERVFTRYGFRPDLAHNTFGWQWTAGCGADAAPWFRIFNPVLQGEKFDPRGDYVRKWVPGLGRLPGRWIHRPWEAPAAVLAEAGVAPGRNYPRPVVDHAAARARALAALSAVRARLA